MTAMSESTPAVSVVLIVGDQRARAARALGSVLSQAGIEQAEVILGDAGSAGQPPLPLADDPRVRSLHLSRALSFGEMRAEGVRQARGEMVAFMEEHCMALSGWLAAIMAAGKGPWAGVGGEVHNALPGAGISDAVWLMNYPARWRPPARYGPSKSLPGQNSAYKREVLLALDSDLPSLLQSEILLMWKLVEQGYEIGIDPAIKFRHINETSLRQLGRGYYWMHRSFGHARAQSYRWSWATRLARVLATPLLPWVRLMRYTRLALRDRPDDLRIICRHAPALVIAQYFSALGMAVGYLLGPGDSARQFTQYELDLMRGE